jgi:membrane protease YdiL (CAAX protease family)
MEGLRKAAARVGLGVLSLVSLGLVTTSNRLAGALAPRLPWLPDSCLGSLVVCFFVYLSIRPSRPFGGPVPRTPWPRLLRVSSWWLALWLAGSAAAALAAGHWQRYRLATTPAQIAAFLILGPLQEELLFRGAIFELAQRSAPASDPRGPIAWSAVCFALHHLQLHGYQLTPSALLQVAFALPMGWAFGTLRSLSGSLWPGLALHVATNAPGAVGR